MIQWVVNKNIQVFLFVYLTPGYSGVYDVMRLCLFEVGEKKTNQSYTASQKEELHERTGYQRWQLIS